MEIWVRPNRRALWLGMALPGLGVLVGGALVWIAWPPAPGWRLFVLLSGAGLAGASLLAVAGLAWVLRLPRVARVGDEVWFYLAGAVPFRVPLDAVEAFLSGKSTSAIRHRSVSEAAAIVVRIADRYRDFHGRSVKPSLGTWSDGYISIRGTWCEPITIDLIKSLNRRLHEAQREREAVRETPG